MPRFAANLSMMYPELPFLDRFEAAAKDGFKAVEYLFPYALPRRNSSNACKPTTCSRCCSTRRPAAPTRPPSTGLERRRQRHHLHPGREDEFRAGVALALDYAQALDCPRIHLMAGLVPQGLTRDAVSPTYIANLRWAAGEAAKYGRDVLIEPINTRDIPGFFLNRQDQAHALVAEVGVANLKVQMDLYHCQIVEGDVAMKIRQYLPTGRVGHFQIAGVPERHEPDIGELNYPYLFKVIDEVAAQCGWDGWIGCEYKPKRGGQPGGTSAGLGWFGAYRVRS
jgi:hydroxypyruvate isomerase